MKSFVTIFILILFFQSSSTADDISEFQIEGISIGDSALNFFSKEEIINNKVEYYKRNEYSTSLIYGSFNNYNAIQISYLTNDKKFKIVDLTAIVDYENNIEQCFNEIDNIAHEIRSIFKDVDQSGKINEKHPADKTGKSKTVSYDFYFASGDWIYVSCFDWSDEIEYYDNLRLVIGTRVFTDWLETAYK